MHPAAAGVRTRLSPVLGPPAHGKRPKRRKIQTVSVAVASTRADDPPFEPDLHFGDLRREPRVENWPGRALNCSPVTWPPLVEHRIRPSGVLPRMGAGASAPSAPVSVP